VMLASAVSVASAALLSGGANAAAAVPAPAWSSAIEVPSLAALNASGRAEVLSVSCDPGGNCTAGGSYRDSLLNLQGFVVTEQNGIWGSAIEVPGLAALNTGGQAEVESVSCGAAGDCAAGGYFYDSLGRQQGFVASDQSGTWGNANSVPALAALSSGFAEVESVSCGLAGDCAAGGFYYDRHGQQGFVVSELNGSWGKAIEVPGLAALNADGSAQVTSVSCGPTGGCAAAGSYKDAHKRHQGFVADELNGTWGKATWVPGTVALNSGGVAATTSVSCPSPGSCAAAGFYKGRVAQQGFVASQRKGSWGKAVEVPGLAALNNGFASVLSVSCGSAGNCAVSGYYEDKHGHGQGFVASERSGTWQKAISVPGLPTLNAGGTAKVRSVSCGTAGNCAAGGSYLNGKGLQQGFVVSEQNGTWGKAAEVPGLAALNTGSGQVWSVSCGAAGNCAAGGFYQDRHRNTQGYVASQG
jgi:hypothetical protein